MIDIIIDALLDTIKLLPYLIITFIILEVIEHKLNDKNKKVLQNNKKIGPLLGGVLGGLPQCGFSAMASSLFSSRVITRGTLIAVFLATSDEMLPIMISERTNFTTILTIVGFKVLVGIIIGFIIDLLIKDKTNPKKEIEEICEHDHCHCNEDNLIISSIKHAVKIAIFILIANLLIGSIIEYIGEDKLSNLLLQKNIFIYPIASLVGLIPNCASSVIITELYLANLITVGTLLSALLTGSGIGILVLFKTNKNIKENISILASIYFVGVITGFIIDFLI